jgi:SAM-dependent methyltransferase
MWYILFILCVLIILGTAAYGGKSAAIWVPMARGDAERAVALAGVQPGDRVYDLGCGDGRVVMAAAALGAKATGFEVSLVPYMLAHIRRLRFSHRHTANIRYANLWKQDISDADVICIYLMPDMYEKIMKKILSECAPGTTVITYVWPITTMEDVGVSVVEGKPKIWKYIL